MLGGGGEEPEIEEETWNNSNHKSVENINEMISYLLTKILYICHFVSLIFDNI